MLGIAFVLSKIKVDDKTKIIDIGAGVGGMSSQNRTHIIKELLDGLFGNTNVMSLQLNIKRNYAELVIF